MTLNDADRRKLSRTLEELGRSVEKLLLTGLTTASAATRQSLQAAFQEASRLRLLRLGSTLQAASEELGRFVDNDAAFSRTRLAFFLNRAWLLGRGLLRALENNDGGAFDKLVWTAPQQAVDRVEVITLGVLKKVVARAFVAFDFRLRLVAPAEALAAGLPLSWSCIFPLKSGQDIPAEAFLHLPQKQKFTTIQFLEGNTMILENVAVTVDDAGFGRLSLTERSTVVTGSPLADYDQYLTWDPGRALGRITQHEPGPFDLEIEMQEEIVFRDWELSEPLARDEEKQWWYPLRHGAVDFVAVCPMTDDAKCLRKELDELATRKRRGKKGDCPPNARGLSPFFPRSPLYGLLHYEKCRLMVQPLTLFTRDGPRHLMLSPDKVDRATLLKVLRF